MLSNDQSCRLNALEPEIGSAVVEEFDMSPARLRSTPFKMARFTVAPGATTDVDVHDVQEIWMLAAGQGTVIYEDTAVELGPGDVVHFESRKPHRFRNDGSTESLIFSVWW